ncbi:MAG: 2-oxoglutarate dehydrogenase E1 component [Alphaproteobacteria bacterium]
MSFETVLTGANAPYIAEVLAQWQKDPASVDSEWGAFFESLDEEEQSVLAEVYGASWRPRKEHILGSEEEPQQIKEAIAQDGSMSSIMDTIQAIMLIRTWRVRGHLIADLDPLDLSDTDYHPELDPKFYGFSESDWDRSIFINFYLGLEYATLNEIMDVLKQTYAGAIGVEFMHIMDPDIKAWIQSRVEGSRSQPNLTKEERLKIHRNLARAESFEKILAKRFAGTKRFGLDGGESTIAALEEILRRGSELGVKQAVFGMAHRGRLNVLANILQKPFRAIVSEFQGNSANPSEVQGSGDVKYHLGASANRVFGENEIHLSLAANPSHLEAVNTVVQGKVRAKQDRRGRERCKEVMGVLIHGDAAFAGQGIVAEGLMMSELEGYRTNGTIHLITNNQIGFTTHPHYSRSSPYCSDVAKMIQCPIFHVNGDNPEAVAFVARLAAEYRQEFGKDVVIDLFCYRRFGHNEGDEPRFTQPIMYKTIESHPTTYELHAKKLVEEKLITTEEAQKMRADIDDIFEKEFDEGGNYNPEKADWFQDQWKGLVSPSEDSREEELKDTDTAVSPEVLKDIGQRICVYPEDLNINPKVKRVIDARRQMMETGEGIDWGMAEALAFGTLLEEGIGIRLSGEDSGRGTFSHRHAVIVDQQTEKSYIPLREFTDKGVFQVWNSPLSEYGVLGFEYGYAAAEPWKLVLWEAQFGDFANGAQIMIDQFISSSESKWLRMCGLVMLLPHGYEGQGPEHSSARLERYLQACAENNWQVVNPTTPANYFHALRRQMKRNFRKPLVVMSPKSLLRHKLVVSNIAEFGEGKGFKRVYNEIDPLIADDKVRRLILCSGKVYWDLIQARREQNITDVAIVRIEQLYPFPWSRIAQQFERYPNAEIVFAQEEPANAGAWTYIYHRLRNLLEDMEQDGRKIWYIGRPNMASPAVGLMRKHNQELENIIKWAFNTDVTAIPQPFRRIRQWQRSGQASN